MPVRLTNRCSLAATALFLAAFAVDAQVPTRPLPMVPAPGMAQLPATAPTNATVPTNLTAPIAAPLAVAASRRPQRATVTYAAGLLDVRANDSSLNSILREIGRQTGMTISGGVADQRVFGNYGPAEPSVVLATLLDGTGTNLLLREAADNSPAELILTPRNGGATPPGPSSAQYSDAEEGAAQLPAGLNSNRVPPAAAFGRPGYPQGQPRPGATSDSAISPLPAAFRNSGVLGDPNAVSPSAATLPVTNSVPVNSLPVPVTAQSPGGIVSAPSGPPAGTTTSGFNTAAQSNAASSVTPTNDADNTGSNLPGGSTSTDGSGTAPNGVKTPEQIFQQLQQLRRANQAQIGAPQGQSGSTPTVPPTPQSTIPQ